jgi:glycolate oxidase
MEGKKLSQEAYKALEDIVGPEYITCDPVILKSYSFVWGAELYYGDRLLPFDPLGVVIPGSAEEVQAIVKTCNRFRIKYKAFASGFHPVAIIGREPFLVVDLRRLNRILTIDEKNMIAVVEPYVSLGELFFECIKRGLRYNAIGVGPMASVLATSCCHDGITYHGISNNYGGQNVLGVEWVLPNGELIRLGSMATDSGWFTADGPGLNLRAIMRGRGAPNGGLGIITKAAVRLAPWYGPPVIKIEGTPPSYELGCEVPENYKASIAAFHSAKDMMEFTRLLEEERMAMACQKIAPVMAATWGAVSNDDFLRRLRSERAKELMKFGPFAMGFILDAFSREELELKEACLQKILGLTNGVIVPLTPEEERALFTILVVGVGKAMRAGGTFYSVAFYAGNYDSCLILSDKLKKTLEHLRPLVERGSIGLASDEYVLVPVGGQWVHFSQVCTYDLDDPEAIKALKEIEGVIVRMMVEESIGMHSESFVPEDSMLDIAADRTCNFPQYIRKIKQLLDPNLVSESTFYVTPKA